MTWTVPKGAHGVDVSHWQGTIDWAKAKKAGVGFVTAKVTQGHSYVDPDGHRNLATAVAAGVTAAAYHFAQPDPDQAPGSATGEAAHYAAHQVGGPAVLDWEATGRKGVSLADVDADWQVRWIRKWATRFDTVIVYADMNTAERVGKAAAAKSLKLPYLWLAHWIGKKGAKVGDVTKVQMLRQANRTVAGWGKPVWWQWADLGEVDGIGGGLDLDVAVTCLDL